MISLSMKSPSGSGPNSTMLLRICLVITPTPMTITPIAIIIYPFTVQSELLYMNEVEGPREDLL